MPNLRKKKEQNKRNYIESQESKKAAAHASYKASPELTAHTITIKQPNLGV